MGIGHPYPETLAALRDRVDVEQSEIGFVGVEELVQ